MMCPHATFIVLKKLYLSLSRTCTFNYYLTKTSMKMNSFTWHKLTKVCLNFSWNIIFQINYTNYKFVTTLACFINDLITNIYIYSFKSFFNKHSVIRCTEVSIFLYRTKKLNFLKINTDTKPKNQINLIGSIFRYLCLLLILRIILFFSVYI